MADHLSIPSTSGRHSYGSSSDEDNPSPLFELLPTLPTRTSFSRPFSTHQSHPYETLNYGRPSLAKLAETKDSVFRFFRSALSNNSKVDGFNLQQPRRASIKAENEEMPGVDFLRSSYRAHQNNSSTNLPTGRRPSLFDEPSTNDLHPAAERARAGSLVTDRARAVSIVADRARSGSINIPDEKPLASAGGVSIGVSLAEPVLFLQGYDLNDSSTRSTAMLRGSLHLKVVKAAKIKAVTLKFKGVSTTRWPEGWSQGSHLMEDINMNNQEFHPKRPISMKPTHS